MSPEPRPALEDTQRAMRWLVAIEDHVYKGLRERYVTELTTIQHALDAQAGARGDERALSDALVKYGAEHIQGACAKWRDRVIERHGARPYSFRFTTRRRGDEDLDSSVSATSPLYYLGGKVETLAEVKARGDAKDRILIVNMECNGWDRVVTTTNGYRWTQPLNPTDVVLEPA